MNLAPLLEASLPIQIHVFTVVPAFVIGLFQFALPKGTFVHRTAGYTFMALMLVTSVSAFFIESFTGSRFSLIHLFIPLTISGLFLAWRAARQGRVMGHIFAIMSVYIGAIGIAGYFAFMPGRIMHKLAFGG